MSVALLERRLADSAKTRGTIIQAIKTEDRYKEHRIKRKWKASEVFAMITESQNHEKYLARRDVGTALERFWERYKTKQFSKLDLLVSFNTRLKRVEQSTIRLKKAAMQKVGTRPPPAAPGSKRGSRGVEPHTVASTRPLRPVAGRPKTPRLEKGFAVPKGAAAAAISPLPGDTVSSSVPSLLHI